MRLSRDCWQTIHVGKVFNVAGVLDERGKPIFQTETKGGDLTGWRYGSNLNQAKIAADEPSPAPPT